MKVAVWFCSVEPEWSGHEVINDEIIRKIVKQK